MSAEDVAGALVCAPMAVILARIAWSEWRRPKSDYMDSPRSQSMMLLVPTGICAGFAIYCIARLCGAHR